MAYPSVPADSLLATAAPSIPRGVQLTGSYVSRLLGMGSLYTGSTVMLGGAVSTAVAGQVGYPTVLVAAAVVITAGIAAKRIWVGYHSYGCSVATGNTTGVDSELPAQVPA